MTILKSFIKVGPDSDFPIQNLPYGVFTKKNDETPRIGTAIGDFVLDLHQLEKNGFFKKSSLKDTEVFLSPVLNPYMAKGKAYRVEVRNYLQKLLSA